MHILPAGRIAALAALVGLLSSPGLIGQTPPSSLPSSDEIIHRIDLAVQHRTQSVSAYTVQELYTLYRNKDTDPSVQVTVKTTYNRNTGKDYAILSQTGSTLLRNAVIDRVISNEREMAKASNRESVALTSVNYEMRPEPGIVTQNGRPCVIVDLKARRKIPFLFNGRGWFDASDFTLVHIEGSPAASPSFFAGQTAGVRDYTKVDGFSMALRANVHSHSFLFGDTRLQIDYSNYQIQQDPHPGD
jgi:hypothetical protein